MKNKDIKLVAQNPQCIVVAEYTPSKRKAEHYQSEDALEKDLIEQFIESLNMSSSVDDDWIAFVEKKKIEELEKIIKSEKLNHKETYSFIENAFRD